MEKNKVFNIGLWKTGTKTFGQAIRMLGYRVHDEFWPIEVGLDGDPVSAEKAIKIHKVIVEHDAFSDSPWLNIYKQLYAWYPDAKFVLTVRASGEARAASEYFHARREGDVVEDIPTSQVFVDQYEKHNEEVKAFFKDKPNQLLEMCFEQGDGWNKLCRFLNVFPPNVPFPHENKTNHHALIVELDKRVFHIERLLNTHPDVLLDALMHLRKQYKEPKKSNETE